MTKQIWLVRTNSDLIEGKGSMHLKAAFSNQAAADAYKNGEPSIMGSDKGGNASDILKLPLYDKASEARGNEANAQRQSEKQRILAKLTPEERKILGL